MKDVAKAVARRRLGRHYPRAQTGWRRLRPFLPWNRYQAACVAKATREYVNKWGLVVRRGPFAGMTYVEGAVDQSITLVPKLVGAYERELHSWITRLISRGYRTWVDVGCADGYYAVGLARRAPRSAIYAFDIDATSRALCREVAEANGVRDRVVVGAGCDSSFLEHVAADDTLIFLDCEGCELDLLNLQAAPRLSRATVLVELHDWVVPNLSSQVLPRFSDTHRTELIKAEPRSSWQFPELRELEPRIADLVLSEGRPEMMSWALLTPRDLRDTGTARVRSTRPVAPHRV